jgi:hypothetical protein
MAEDDSKLGDWRIDRVTTLAEDHGSILAGTPVRLMSTAPDKLLKHLGFITPSIPALCLSVAIDAASRAEIIRQTLNIVPSLSPQGVPGQNVADDSISNLYDFFELAIVSATMSFQAIESFANATVGRGAKSEIVIKRKGGKEERYSPKDAERFLGTDDKIQQVLPDIFKVKSPTDSRAWAEYKELKQTRDRVVHFKSKDIYTNQLRPGDGELLFRILETPIHDYPSAAIKMFEYFTKGNAPRWLRLAKERLVDDTRKLIVPGGYTGPLKPRRR